MSMLVHAAMMRRPPHKAAHSGALAVAAARCVTLAIVSIAALGADVAPPSPPQPHNNLGQTCAEVKISAPASVRGTPGAYAGFVGHYRVAMTSGADRRPRRVNGHLVFEQQTFLCRGAGDVYRGAVSDTRTSTGTAAAPAVSCAENPFSGVTINGVPYGRAWLYYDAYERSWKLGPGVGDVAYSMVAVSDAPSPERVEYGHVRHVLPRAGTFPGQRIRSGWHFLVSAGGDENELVAAPGVTVTCLRRLACAPRLWQWSQRDGLEHEHEHARERAGGGRFGWRCPRHVRLHGALRLHRGAMGRLSSSRSPPLVLRARHRAGRAGGGRAVTPGVLLAAAASLALAVAAVAATVRAAATTAAATSQNTVEVDLMTTRYQRVVDPAGAAGAEPGASTSGSGSGGGGAVCSTGASASDGGMTLHELAQLR